MAIIPDHEANRMFRNKQMSIKRFAEYKVKSRNRNRDIKLDYLKRGELVLEVFNSRTSSNSLNFSTLKSFEVEVKTTSYQEGFGTTYIKFIAISGNEDKLSRDQWWSLINGYQL